MRKLSKILVLVLALSMLFAMASMFTASAAAPDKLYLTPNANWKQSNARFAAYFFGNGETWVSMTDSDKDGVYEVDVPAGYPNVIFCRMNPSTTANNWNNKWNQTADLTIPTSGTNHYTVKESTWDKGGGTWSTFGSTCAHANKGPAATCTTAQECLDCGDPIVSALGHAYNTAHLCTRCGNQATFVIAGNGAHLGGDFNPSLTVNNMTYDEATGTYTKVYTNVAKGSYKFKCVRDNDTGWGTAYPSADKTYTVATSGSTVTMTLKGTTVTVTVEAPHTHDFSDATCTEAPKCSCGETQGEALGHDFVKGVCSRCEAVDPDYVPLIPGAGTEEDPFVIGSLEALIAFRDSVNAGETDYNAEGVYVVLGADIDMAEVDWSVNIGDDCNATFDGIFDGKGHKILNLNATETAQKADGYVCSGLFGAIYGNAVIKNLTIENVSINTGDFTGNNVAAVVGFVYSGTGSIENVTVCGDIKIDANGVYGVGAIVGYSYYGSNLTIKDCKVVGNEGSYIKAVSGAGAIAGYAYGIHVVNAEVSGLTIEGAGLLGGLIGIAVNNSTDVNGAHVANVTLNATKDVWVNGTGIAVGTLSSNSIKIEGVTFENVTGADTLLGSAYAEKPETVVPAFIARIGDVYYTDIQEAIAAAQAGETVYVFAGTYALPSMKAGIAIEGVGEVLFEGTLSGTLENLTLKNIHIKGGNAQRWAYAKGDLVFENVIFEATGIYALHFDGITEGATLLYKDCTIIGWAAMSGSPASCVFDGCTIKGNGSYGLIRTYFDATIQNCTFDVSNVNPDDVYQDGIHAVDATVTVNNCTNVNGEMKDIIDTSKVGYIVLDGETIHIHKYDVTETVAATCTTAGSTTYTCPCGHTYTEEVEALGHDIVVDSAAVDATCTATGLTAAEHCSRCDYVKTQEEVEALGHDFVEGICSRCSEEDPNYEPPHIHKDTGLDAKCDECGEYFVPASPFKLEVYQANNGGTYYFKGAMSGYYFATTNKNSLTGAVDVYAEETDGGYYLYFLSGTTKNYLYIQISGTYTNIKYGSTKAVWAFNTTFGTFTTVVSGTTYYMGSYKTFATISASKISYLSASNMDVSQFPARPVSLVDHVCAEFTSKVTAPTCTAQGYTTKTCVACGVATKVDYVDALGHDLVDVEALAPTCTAAGYTAHKDCSRCTYVEGKEAVDALGHKFFAGACTVCEAADPDYNAYLLNFSQWPEFAKETYADGEIFKYNDIFTFIMGKNSRVDASEKTWDDFTGTLRFSFGGKTPTGAVPTKNALQITVDGAYTIKIWYVAGGDARYFALMDAEGTVLSETTKETVKNGQDYAELVIPAAGTYYFGVPADNNYIFQIELVKHEHQYGEGVVTAPTCTEAGYTTYTCSCGHSYTDSEVAALGHKYEAAVTAPTCTEAGYTIYTCACGDTYTGDEVATLGHTFVYGKCAVCGAADPEYVPYVNTLVVGDTNKIVVDGDTFNDYNLPIEWVAFVADEKATYTFVGDNGALVFIFDAELNLLCGGTGTATLEAGTYLICIGNGLVGELNVAVTKTALPHEHVWSEATCTEPAKCECGETQGEALGHTFAEGLCTVCGAENPDYVPEQPPVDEPTEEPKDEPTTEEPDALAKVWDMILKLLAWVMGFFKNLFVKA